MGCGGSCGCGGTCEGGASASAPAPASPLPAANPTSGYSAPSDGRPSDGSAGPVAHPAARGGPVAGRTFNGVLAGGALLPDESRTGASGDEGPQAPAGTERRPPITGEGARIGAASVGGGGGGGASDPTVSTSDGPFPPGGDIVESAGVEKAKSHGEGWQTPDPLKGKGGADDPGCRCVCECVPNTPPALVSWMAGIHPIDRAAPSPEPDHPDRALSIPIGGEPVAAAATGDGSGLNRLSGILPPPGGTELEPPDPTQVPGPFGSDPWSGPRADSHAQGGRSLLGSSV